MSSQRYFKVLYNSSEAGNGSWFALDSKFESSGGYRTIHGTVASGDFITLQGTVKESVSGILDSEITTIDTFTENFEGTLVGSYQFVRVVKAGTAGVSKVQGYI